MPPDRFRELLLLAQAGDQSSIDRLFEMTVPHVRRAVHFDPARAFGPDESERDLIQKVCLRVFMKLSQFQGAREEPDDHIAQRKYTAWVRKVAESVVRKCGQRIGRRAALLPQVPMSTPAPGDSTNRPGRFEPRSPEPTPSVAMTADERARLVLTALENIADPATREILRLRFFEGLSLRTIAERLHLSYDIVRDRFAAGKKRLQGALESLQ